MKITQHIARYLLTVIMGLTSFALEGQEIRRYNSFSYSVNEGLLQSTVGDMAFDKNNFCWISFPNGIQKFDGKDFTRVPVQPGLPDDKLVYFFKCINGDLLISHTQGISKYEIGGNRFIQVYTPSSETSPAQFIGEDENIIYFYLSTGKIIGIHCHTFKVIAETITGLPDYSSNSDYRPKISDNIINHKIALEVKSSVYLWDLQKRKLVARSEILENMSHYLLRLKSENEVLYLNSKINNALLCYNFTANESKVLYVKGKDEKPIGRCIIYPWQSKILISFSNKLYETDTSLQLLKTELVNFQNKPLGGNSGIAKIKEDNFGNLCISTIMEGVKKIIRNNYPVKYYGTEKKDSNNVLSILPDKKANRILVGTAGNGLLIFDTTQHLIKHISRLPEKNISFTINTIIKNNNGDYLLFVNGEKDGWVLKNNLSDISTVPIITTLPENRRGIYYFGNFLFQDGQKALTQSQGKFYKTDFTTNTIAETEVTTSYTMGGLYYNGTIITHANDELIFADAEKFRELKKIPFKNTGYVRCFVKDGADNIYVGSNNGIFKIDSTGKILAHLKKEDGLPDECIYAMVFDEQGFLWCSTNKGLFKLGRDNSILQLKKEDGLQENEFNTNVVVKTADGEVFFGGVNGVSSFYPAAITDFEEKIDLLVTRIKVNDEERFGDTAVWEIEKIHLPYNQNAVSFDFIAMANNNPGQYIYQYRMEGIDGHWIQNNNMQTVRYHLPPGKYVFKMYASRFFNKDAKPMKEIRIFIQPPFWKTWWFITGLAFLLIALLAYGINQFNRNKFKKRLNELEAEHKLRMERERISRDLHDNIGAYANAVLYNTELLEKEKETTLRSELMNDLKFASKDIIASLRETIWALKNDNYSAEDCMLRIRNFIQPLTRYYQHISFKIEGDIPGSKILHYTRALNLVRIVQEAVTNAIKHADAKTIHILSSEKDGFWQLIVKDDGKGFEPGLLQQDKQGNGLNNMKQRAADGNFGFTMQTGQGTSIIISINGHEEIES